MTYSFEYQSEDDMPSPFAAPSVPTLKDALAAMRASPDFTDVKKKRLEQDVLIACEWVGKKPEQLIAHPMNLGPRFRALSPAKLRDMRVDRKSQKRGVSRKRMANVKSSVSKVIQCVGFANRRSFKVPLLPDWATLDNLIEDRYRRMAVRPLLQIASRRGTQPDSMGEDDSDATLTALEIERLRGEPRLTHQNATRCYNWCVDNISGWPTTKLRVPRYASEVKCPEIVITAELESLIDRFLSVDAAENAFDLSSPMRSYRPATVQTYRKLIRRYLGLLARTEYPVERVTTFRPLLQPALIERAIKELVGPYGKKRGWAAAANIVGVLAQIARNPEQVRNLSNDEVEANKKIANELAQIASRLRKHHKPTGVARERAIPLKNEENMAELFLLPFAMQREIVKSKHGSRRTALNVQLATALLILTFCPLRVSTLASLSERHLVWSRPNRRGDLSLEFGEDELKNGEPASLPLPREVADLMRTYLEKYRGALVKVDTDKVFPGAEADKSKGSATLGLQLKTLIRERLGFVVNVHLYRHLVHIIILRRYPGAYAMIARILTHKSINTAIKNYSHFDVELSLREFQKLVRGVQSGDRSGNNKSRLDRGMYGYEEEDK